MKPHVWSQNASDRDVATYVRRLDDAKDQDASKLITLCEILGINQMVVGECPARETSQPLKPP